MTYEGAGGVFTDIGKIVGAVFGVEGQIEDDVDPMMLEIIVAFDDTTMTNIEGMKAAFDTYKAAANTFRKAISENTKKRLLDPLVTTELGLPSNSDIDLLLEKFRAKMVADGETVSKNVVTLGSVTSGSLNTGNGTLIISKVLDGYNKPGDYMAADRAYAGIDSEMSAKAETLTVECTADSQTSNRAEGSEQFKVYGNPKNPIDATPSPYFGFGLEGSGSSLDGFITGPMSGTLVVNPGFDVWTTDPTPAFTGGWVIDGGVLGTTISKETVNVYRGAAAVALIGNAATDPIQISQPIDPSRLKPLRRYLVSCYVKADAAVAAGTFGVEFNGTGYTVGGTEKISLATGAIPTAWTLKTFQINLPAIIPSDFKIVVKATGALTAGRKIYVDDVFVQPMYYFGGVAMAWVPGANRASIRDKYSFTVSNSRAGKFQSFFGRYFGRQLPSITTGTIDDSLAMATAISAPIGGP